MPSSFSQNHDYNKDQYREHNKQRVMWFDKNDNFCRKLCIQPHPSNVLSQYTKLLALLSPTNVSGRGGFGRGRGRGGDRGRGRGRGRGGKEDKETW